MKTKIAVLSAFIIILTCLCGCSRETKMGFGEFSDRIYKDFDISIDEDTVSLEKQDGKNIIYCKISDFLFVCYLGSNNNISGIAAMLPREKEKSTAEFLDTFGKCVSIFTLQEQDNVKSTLRDIGFSPDKIKFTDGNSLFTVGRFRYSAVMSEQCVTLFCERI